MTGTEVQAVNVSAGAAEYTWPVTITEDTGKDISADQVQVSLGTYAAPGEWAAPDVLTRPTSSSVTVQKLVDATTAAGTYWLWVKVTDDPEVVPRRAAAVIVT